MNKEYIYLSDNELLISNENGHLKKRIVNSDNMRDLLLLENNLEEVESVIKSLEVKFEQEIKLTRFEKVLAYAMPFCIGTVAIVAASLISPLFAAALEVIIPSFVIVCGLGAIAIFIDGRRLKKEKLGRAAQLSKAYEIKKELELKLSKLKNRNVTIAQSKDNNDDLEYNGIITLNDNATRKYILAQLNDSYTQGYKEDSKQLVLSKKTWK